MREIGDIVLVSTQLGRVVAISKRDRQVLVEFGSFTVQGWQRSGALSGWISVDRTTKREQA